jgi:hypothetical protein
LDEIREESAFHCGCPGVTLTCSLCPDDQPAIVGNPACGPLAQTVPTFSAELCASNKEALDANAFVCGCPGTSPACSLCPDSAPMPDPEKPSLSEGSTCAELDGLIHTLTATECESQADPIALNTVECGCAAAI